MDWAMLALLSMVLVAVWVLVPPGADRSPGAMTCDVIRRWFAVMARWVRWDRRTPFEKAKARLEADAKKNLCYGRIAKAELECYGMAFTNSRTGKMMVKPRKHAASVECSRMGCNRHSRREMDWYGGY